MKSLFRRTNRPGPLQHLRQGATWAWVLTLLCASPWIRVHWGEWPLYPGYWIMTAIVLSYLKGTRRPRQISSVPMLPLILLALWMTSLAAAREQWLLAGVIGLAAVANYCWGLAAHRLSREQHLEQSMARALPILLGLCLAFGVLAGAAGVLWPPICRVLNCDGSAAFPPPFLGFWNSPSQYWVFLTLCLPTVGAAMILRGRGLARSPSLPLLLATVGLALAALLPSASISLLTLSVLGLGGLLLLLHAERHPADIRLLAGLAGGVVFGAVVLYGAAPAYLQRVGMDSAAGQVVLDLESPAPELLSSRRVEPIVVRIANSGWRTISADRKRPGHLAARILFTDRLGVTRVAWEKLEALPEPLTPESSQSLRITLRVPEWLESGFVAFQVLDGQGRVIAQSAQSNTGFRYRNSAYRTLAGGDDNWLSPLVQRARILARLPVAQAARRPDAHNAEHVMGELLDTLVFSPIWGEAPGMTGAPFPFTQPRPVFAQLFNGFGLVGVILAGWFLWDIMRRAQWMASAATRRLPRLGWRFVPLAVLLLVLNGFIWNTLGSFHAVWGLFILAGYVEGRHSALAPPKRARPRRKFGRSVMPRLPLRQVLRRPARNLRRGRRNPVRRRR